MRCQKGAAVARAPGPVPRKAHVVSTPRPHTAAPVSELVTVVIPHYGDPAPTRRLLRELRAQEGAPGLAVVVCDDASPQPFTPEPAADGMGAPGGTDRSSSSTASDGASSAQPRIAIVRRATNGGFGANVNTGLETVHTPYALVLNSDLHVTGDFVARLACAALPWQPAVVSPRIVDPQGRQQWTGRHFPTVVHQVVEWLLPLARRRGTRVLHEAVGHDTRAAGTGTVSVDWVVGAALWLPVDQVRRAGGFREDYYMNAEEVDLQLRLRANGIPSVVVGSVSAIHEGGGSSDPGKRRRWLVDARAAYARTWGRPRTLKTALTAATGVNLVHNTLRKLAGRDVTPLLTAREELALLHPWLRGRAGARP